MVHYQPPEYIYIYIYICTHRNVPLERHSLASVRGLRPISALIGRLVVYHNRCPMPEGGFSTIILGLLLLLHCLIFSKQIDLNLMEQG